MPRRPARKNRKHGVLELLEARQLLTATTIPYAVVHDFNQFTGSEAETAFGIGIQDGDGGLVTSKEAPGFAGLPFNHRFDLGGITDPGILGGQWGLEGFVEGSGRIGVEYGYYVNSGQAAITNDGDFTYEFQPTGEPLNPLALVTSLDVNSSKLQTISPTISAYADLVIEAQGNIGGAACFFKCIEGETSFNVSEKIPLLSVNRQTGHVNDDETAPPTFDGDVKVLGFSAANGLDLFSALSDAKEQIFDGENEAKKAKQELDAAKTTNEKQAAQTKLNDANNKIASGNANKTNTINTVPNNQTISAQPGKPTGGITASGSPAGNGLLGLKLDISRDAAFGENGISAPLGSFEVTVPEINLLTEEAGGGTLNASTNDPTFTEGKNRVAALDLKLGSLLSAHVPLLGTTNVTLGPGLEAELITAEYNVKTELFVDQTFQAEVVSASLDGGANTGDIIKATFNSTVVPDGEVKGYVGTGPGLNDADVISAGLPVQQIIFHPGADLTIFPLGNPSELDVTFTIIRNYEIDNDVALDIEMNGNFQALGLTLAYPGGELPLGPVVDLTHKIGEFETPQFDIGSYRTFVEKELPTATIPLISDLAVSIGSQSAVIVDDPVFINSDKKFEFDVIVENLGVADGTNVSVVVDDLNYTGALSAPGCTEMVVGQRYECFVGNLPIAGTQTFKFSGITSLNAGDTLASTATVSAAQDAVAANDTATTDIPIRVQNRKFYVGTAGDSSPISGALSNSSCPTVASDCTLRQAIEAAEDYVGTGVVVIPAGTIQLSHGDINLVEPIVIEGAGSDLTFIRADQPSGLFGVGSRIFQISSGPFPWQSDTEAEFLIKGVALKDGKTSAVIGTSPGGAITINGGALTVEDVAFLNNETEDGDGGAIRASNAEVTIRDSQFIGNQAADRGGAIHIDGGTVSISGSEFTGNSAPLGGALYIESDAQVPIKNSIFTGNFAGAGGEVIESDTLASISANDVVVYNNFRPNFGGVELAETWQGVVDDLGADFSDTTANVGSTRDIGANDELTAGGISYEFVYAASEGAAPFESVLMGSTGNTPMSDSASLNLDTCCNTGNFGVTFISPFTDFDSGVGQVANARRHVVFVAKGTDMDLYVDGVFATTMAGASVNLSGLVGIGGVLNHANSSVSSLMQGDLHGVAVYDRALTAAEIARSAKASKNDELSLNNISDDTSLVFDPLNALTLNSTNVDSLVTLSNPAVLANSPGADVGVVTWQIPGRDITQDPVPVIPFSNPPVPHPQVEIVDHLLKLKPGVSLTAGTTLFVDVLGTDVDETQFRDRVSFSVLNAPSVLTNADITIERNIEADSFGETIRIHWDAAPNTDEYYLDVVASDFSHAISEVVKDTGAATYSFDVTLYHDTEYSLTLDTKNAVGFGSDAGSPPPPPAIILKADVDGNGVVDFPDFLEVSSNFGNTVSPNTSGDIDGDGLVGFSDFLEVSGDYGASQQSIPPPPPATLTTLTTLVAPPSDILQLEAVTTPTSITLTWGDTEREFGYLISRDGIAVSNFHFDQFGNACVSGTAGCTISATNAADNTSITFAATPDTTYEFEVIAVNGSAEATGTASIRTPKLTPTVPLNVTLTELSPTEVQLNWTDSDNETGYRIVEPSFGTPSNQGDPTVIELAENTTSSVVSGLTPGAPYEFIVIAENPDDAAFSAAIPRGLLVSSLGDTVDGNLSPGNLTLREAINLANASSDLTTIGFDQELIDFTTTQTILLGSQLPATNPVGIYGPGADKLAIDANNNGRVFHFSSPMAATYTVEGLTVTNGDVGTADTGGAIKVADNNDTLIVRKSVVSNSFANGGGGISISGNASYHVVDSALLNNKSKFSGSALLAAGSNEGWIINSTISGNQSTPPSKGAAPTSQTGAGALFNQTVSGQIATMHLRNTTVAHNTGAGIQNFSFAGGSATLEVGNSLFANNTGSNAAIGGTGAVFNSLGFNVSDDTSAVLNSPDDMVGVGTALVLPLADSGGPTPTHALPPTSPAVDAGSNALAIDDQSQSLVADQRGGLFGRVVDGNNDSVATVDAGAFEYELLLAGDYNKSGQVEQGDLNLVLLNWGAVATPIPTGWMASAPVGQIDQAELNTVLLNWGNSFLPSAPPLAAPALDVQAIAPRDTLAGDANRDGHVSFDDFLILSANFGNSGAFWVNGDFDADTRVSFADFLALSTNYGNPFAAPSQAAIDTIFEDEGISVL